MVPIIYGRETETGDIQGHSRVIKLFVCLFVCFQSNLYDINPVVLVKRQSETKRGRWLEANPSVHTKTADDGENHMGTQELPHLFCIQTTGGTTYMGD